MLLQLCLEHEYLPLQRIVPLGQRRVGAAGRPGSRVVRSQSRDRIVSAVRLVTGPHGLVSNVAQRAYVLGLQRPHRREVRLAPLGEPFRVPRLRLVQQLHRRVDRVDLIGQLAEGVGRLLVQQRELCGE